MLHIIAIHFSQRYGGVLRMLSRRQAPTESLSSMAHRAYTRLSQGGVSMVNEAIRKPSGFLIRHALVESGRITGFLVHTLWRCAGIEVTIRDCLWISNLPPRGGPCSIQGSLTHCRIKILGSILDRSYRQTRASLLHVG